MRILLIALFTLTISFTNAQLVNDIQKNEKRLALLKAYDEERVIKIMGRKYQVLDVNYFFIDNTKQSFDGVYTEYKWASKDGFLIGKDSLNLSEIRVRNLKTKKMATFRYIELIKYEVEFLKRRVRG